MSVEDFIKLHWFADLALRLNGERVLCFDDGGGDGDGGGGDGDGGDGDDGDDAGDDVGDEADQADQAEADLEDPEANFDFTSPDITGFDAAAAAGQSGMESYAEASPADIAAAIDQSQPDVSTAAQAEKEFQDQSQQDLAQALQDYTPPTDKTDKTDKVEETTPATTTAAPSYTQDPSTTPQEIAAVVAAQQAKEEQTQQDLAQNFSSFTSFEPPAPASPTGPTMSDVNAFGYAPGTQTAAATIMDLANPMGVQVQDIPPGAPLTPSATPQQGPLEAPAPAPGQSPSAAPPGPYENTPVEKEFNAPLGQPEPTQALGAPQVDERGFEIGFASPTGMPYADTQSTSASKGDFLGVGTMGATQTDERGFEQAFGPQSNPGSYVFDQPPEQVPAAAPPTFQDIWSDRVDVPNTTLSPGQFNQMDQAQLDREARGAVPTTVEPGPAPGVAPGIGQSTSIFDTVAPTTSAPTTSYGKDVYANMSAPVGQPPPAAPPAAPQSMNPGPGRFSENPSQDPKDYFGQPPGQQPTQTPTPTPTPSGQQPSAPPPFDQPGPTIAGGFDPGSTDGGGGDFLNPQRGQKSFDATSPTTPGTQQVAQALAQATPVTPNFPVPPQPQPQTVPDTSFQRRPVGDQGDANFPDQVRLARIRAALAQSILQQQGYTDRGFR